MADSEAGGSIYTGAEEAVEATAKPRFRFDNQSGQWERVSPSGAEAEASKAEESIAGKEGVNAGDGAAAGGKSGSRIGRAVRRELGGLGRSMLGDVQFQEKVSGDTTGKSGISDKSSNTQKYDQGAQGRTTTDYKEQWTRTETDTTTTTYQTSPVGGSLIEGMPHGNQSHVERALALAKASVAKSNAGIDASGHGVSDQVSGDRENIGDKVNERADNAMQLRKPKGG